MNHDRKWTSQALTLTEMRHLYKEAHCVCFSEPYFSWTIHPFRVLFPSGFIVPQCLKWPFEAQIFMSCMSISVVNCLAWIALNNGLHDSGWLYDWSRWHERLESFITDPKAKSRDCNLGKRMRQNDKTSCHFWYARWKNQSRPPQNGKAQHYRRWSSPSLCKKPRCRHSKHSGKVSQAVTCKTWFTTSATKGSIRSDIKAKMKMTRHQIRSACVEDAEHVMKTCRTCQDHFASQYQGKLHDCCAPKVARLLCTVVSSGQWSRGKSLFHLARQKPPVQHWSVEGLKPEVIWTVHNTSRNCTVLRFTYKVPFVLVAQGLTPLLGRQTAQEMGLITISAANVA